MIKKRVLAIIGIGPRGGYALENFIIELVKQDSFSQIHLLLFEETNHFGNGQVYNTNQVKTNWININERVLLLDKRAVINLAEFKIPAFPSYHEWINKDFSKTHKEQVDTYPPRALVGDYLKERFQTLITPLLNANIVAIIKERVEKVEILSPNKIALSTNLKTYKDINEVLLTIGHQPTKTSKQIQEWAKFASEKPILNLFQTPYPIEQFLNCNNLTVASTIGVRGFGLAMIDVVRGIASKFGDFETKDNTTMACLYKTDYAISDMFIPFSLDGLPPAPKPLNAQIDEWFKPTKEQLLNFENTIKNTTTQKEASSPKFLIEAFSPIAAKIYSKLANSYTPKLPIRDIEIIVEKWLNNQNYEHTIIISKNQSTSKSMQDFVGMATGKKTISLDYCIGQVWRHCQPSIYAELSFNNCSDKVFSKIIQLDESTKRYSYGPPAESIQQLLALTKARVMNLDMVNNPEFELTNNGWNFRLNGKTITANIMIDSVLDSPKIKDVNSPIIKNMLANNLIEAVHDELGVATDENGYVISSNKNNEIPIALLGRLAKGTIIGVDAILECFGTRAKKWALEAANRHVNKISKL